MQETNRFLAHPTNLGSDPTDPCRMRWPGPGQEIASMSIRLFIRPSLERWPFIITIILIYLLFMCI